MDTHHLVQHQTHTQNKQDNCCATDIKDIVKMDVAIKTKKF